MRRCRESRFVASMMQVPDPDEQTLLENDIPGCESHLDGANLYC